MRPIVIRLRVEDIEGVSDRTARAIFKGLSQVCRRAQVREFDELLRFAEATRRERQSLNDRLKPKYAEVPVYYLKQARQGSFVLEAALGAFMIWLLQSTLGETVKDAYKKTKFHKAIVDWVENQRPERVSALITDEANKQDFLGGRARVQSIQSESTPRRQTIEIILRVAEYEEIKQPEPVTERLVLDNARDILRTLR